MNARLRKKSLVAQIELLTAKATKLPDGPYKRLVESQAGKTALRLAALMCDD